jgi:hypothetical protein
MASSYTDLLRLEKQANGENSTTWGTKVNTVFEMIEDGIGGIATLAVTGGTDVLTTNNSATDEARMAILKVTGTLVSNETLQVGATSKIYYIWNATSGAFTVDIEVSGGTSIEIPQGSKVACFTDGTDFYLLSYANSETATTTIASASTIDLTTTAGDRVFQVTGTTATSAVTMNTGQFAILVAEGAWPLTHNATTNRINNAGSDYTLAAGDWVFYHKGSNSVVRGTIIKADGTALVASTTTEATQAQQEAAASSVVFVTPAVQHHHPTAAKVWCCAGISGNILTSHNMTSVTDNGTGDISFNYTTVFSGTSYSALVNSNYTKGLVNGLSSGQGPSVYRAQTLQGSIPVVRDPISRWSFAAFGDQ